MSEYLQKIIYLTQAQYDTLKTNGTVGAYTGINDNYLYFITDEAMSASDLSEDFVLPVTKGGTGKTQVTSGSLLIGNGTSTLNEIAATSVNTHNTIIKRDSNGNFSAGTITASLAGNANTATSAGALAHKTLTTTTVNNTSGSYAFSIAATTGMSQITTSSTDYVGLQIGDSVDKWQLTATGNSLFFRQNDNGGTNTSWNAWTKILSNSTTSAGTNNAATLTWDTTYTIAKIDNTDIKFTTMEKPTYAFSDLTAHPTTLSGYGITDAKIASGTITLGSNTISPVTAINWDSTNKKLTRTINGTAADVVTAATLRTDLGLSNALHFIGITSTTLADGSTTATLTAKSTGSLSKTTGFVDGDVVMDGNQLREYVWSGSAWRLLGITTSTAYTQPASTATNTWIAQVSQGTDGKITATTGSLNTSGTWSGKANKLSDLSSSDSASSSDTWRYVWFSYNDNTTGRPAYDSTFAYQSSTKTLKVNHIILNHASGNSKELEISYGSTIDYWWGVGTDNENHGLYDVKANKWILSAGTNNIWSFDGNATSATSAGKWTTACNISISDSDGTNTGTAVSVDGSAATTLKLPATIKADLTGNASTVTSTAGTSTLAWGNEVTLYTVGGAAIKAKLPSNPNSDHYTSAWCDTAAGTQAKAAYCTNYTLTANTWLHVLIKNANTYNGKITLNVNNTGAKDIWINGTVSSSTNKTLPAGTYLIYYDGTKYQFRTDGQLPGNISGSAGSVSWDNVSGHPTNLSQFTNDSGYVTSSGVTSITIKTTSPITGGSDTATTSTGEYTIAHATGDGNLHVPATGTTNNGKVLKAGSTAGSIGWGTLSASDVGAAPSSTVSCTTANVKTALGTGSGTTKFLREDGTWQTPAYTTNTDEKLKIAAVTSGTTYYPIVAANSTAAANRQYDATGLAYLGTNGTTSTVGVAKITLGNSTASGTANNKQGSIGLYGSTAYLTTIISGAPTAANTLTLPTATGTFALTSDLPTTVSKTAAGLCPILPNETTTTKFLCQDGSWVVPSYIPDTHHTAYLRAGAANGTANAATTTGNTYLLLVENSTHRSGVKLVPGSNMSITSDASGNVTFTSSYSNTATAADNILDGSNSGTQITYAPYSAQQTKLSFDTSTTAPTRTDRLNLNGSLYATTYNVAGYVTLQWNSTDSSLDFVFA